MTHVGDGEWRYRAQTGWAQVPEGTRLGDVAAVGVAADGRVYAFSRGDHPMAVFDAEGRFERSWGQDIFTRAHGLQIAPDGYLYCTDDGDHTVRKCTPDGEVLLTIGLPGRSSEYLSGEPFHRCTHTALSPDGDIYVSDGYGNARVHCYAPDGTLRFSWGRSGSDPGEFYLPHNIVCDADGWVYVADRENHRVQVFDGTGRYETAFHDLYRPCALCLTPDPDPRLLIGELGPLFNNRTPWVTGIGARCSVLDRSSGAALARLGAQRVGTGPDEFIAPHGIAVDAAGAIYVGEVSYTSWSLYYGDAEPPPDLTTVRKLVPDPIKNA